MDGAMDYGTSVEYILGFADFERARNRRVPEAFALDRINSLMDRLDRPQDGSEAAPRLTVHVAGSKGKGSTAAMIESILRAAGLRTGFFSSPHVHEFRERIRLDGEPIAPERFAALVEQVRPILEAELQAAPGRLSTFEILTAMAFSAFRDAAVDAQVIEVGLGGRLDCTNVMRRKDAAVVTALSKEHVHVLGDDIRKIAWEKAGIVHAATNAVVLGPQRSEAAAEAVRAHVEDVEAPLIDVAERYETEPAGHEAAGQWFRLRRRQPAPGEAPETLHLLSLLGRHQIENAATALATIDELRRQGLTAPEAALHTGLATVAWPGRLETIARDPRVVIDGAHNEESLARVLDSLPDYFAYDRLIAVIGVLGDKDLAGMADRLAARAAAVVVTAAGHPRSRPAQDAAEVFASRIPEIVVEPRVATAVETARSLAGPNDLVCVLGSLFVAAEARAYIQRQAGGRPTSARADREP
ncbi:MAG: bifunctional folylpolyglutamate synthase/dihydrofolate synthase [Chloroflexi bacterium]|nr:bifunctional folylpolyglutamate synthase/dihydrofolate synthase [Chloroflexota bacterium]